MKDYVVRIRTDNGLMTGQPAVICGEIIKAESKPQALEIFKRTYSVYIDAMYPWEYFTVDEWAE